MQNTPKTPTYISENPNISNIFEFFKIHIFKKIKFEMISESCCFYSIISNFVYFVYFINFVYSRVPLLGSPIRRHQFPNQICIRRLVWFCCREDKRARPPTYPIIGIASISARRADAARNRGLG